MLAFEQPGSEKNLSSSPLPDSPSPTAVTDCEFIEGLPSSEAHKRATLARNLLGCASRALALWLIEIDKRKLYLDFCCSSVYQYASLHLSLEGHAVSEYLRTGRALQNLPSLSRAYEKGEISSSKMREITRVAVPETDAFWTESAKKCTTREIEKMVVYTPKGGLPFEVAIGARESVGVASPTGKMDKTDKIEMRNAQEGIGGKPVEEAIGGKPIEEEKRIKYHDKLIIELAGDQMAVVKDAFDKARKESGLKDRASLLEFMARQYLSGSTEIAGNGRKAPYQIVLHSHPTSGIAWVESMNGERYISPSTLDKALCDAEIIDLRDGVEREGKNSTAGTFKENRIEDPGMVEDSSPTMGLSLGSGNELTVGLSHGDRNDPAGKSLANSPTVGLNHHVDNELLDYVNALYAIYRNKKKGACKHKAHIPWIRESAHYLRIYGIPPALRAKVLLRDRHTCQAPGCGCKAFILLHHIVPLGAGGENSEYNILVLCYKCHALVHDGILRVSGQAPSNLIWRDKDGRILIGNS